MALGTHLAKLWAGGLGASPAGDRAFQGSAFASVSPLVIEVSDTDSGIRPGETRFATLPIARAMLQIRWLAGWEFGGDEDVEHFIRENVVAGIMRAPDCER